MANDFTNDPNCVALWRFEDGALTADSIGTNTLTNNAGVVSNQVDFMEGLASADFEADSTQYMSITDANLDAGFPLKNGDANKKISICGWFQLESLATWLGLFSKYDTDSKTSISIAIENTGSNFTVLIGYNNGDSGEFIYRDGTIFTGKWYHFGVTFQDSDKSWKVVIWDDTGGSKIINASGTATNNIHVEDAPVAVGCRFFTAGSPEFPMDGEMDEVVVFKDILTTGEIDKIRQGVYTGGFVEATITAGVGLGAEAGTPKPESVTWNPFDKHAEIVLSLGDLRASSADDNGSGYFPVRATAGKSTGKWYFEVAFVLPWDFVRIGVANLAQSMATGQFPGASTNSWGYAAGTGKKYYNNSGTSYGDDWTDGDVIGIAVDMDAGKIWFSKNGVWQASGNPGAGTNQAYTGLSGTLYPMAGPYGSFGDSIHCDATFIEQDFSYAPPSGFEPWDDFDKAVEADAGLGATVEVDTLSDTIEPGVGIQAQVEAEAIYNKEVSAGAGVSAQAAASGIYGKEVEAGVGVQAESSVFNWAEWLAIYGNQYTARYYLTLTGAPDDLADVVIPISSFQYRLRDDTPSYLQVVIPGVDYATDIADRANGELIVEMAYLVAGVEQHREQLARVDLEDVQLHEGPRNKSIILVGHRTESWGAQIVTLRGITYQSDKNGLIRIRCAEPDLFLRPGNTVKAGDETFTAGQVMTAVAKHTQWMEVVEAA